jgi:magnesium transporter
LAREYDRGMADKPTAGEASELTFDATPEESPKPDGDQGPSTCLVVHAGGAHKLDFSRDAAESLLATGGFFWLDLYQPTQDDFDVLRDVFKFHPLALEDSEQFGQRPKLDDYDDFVFLVVYGAVPDQDRLVEVHSFYSDRYLLTVHRDDAPAFAEVRRRYQKRGKPVEDPALLLYRIIDGLVDSFFPILADFDDRIDELEDQIFLKASDDQLQEIFAMKRLLVGIRKAVTPQRDMFAGLLGGVAELPGMTQEAERYFRDIYDHLIRISDLIDTYRDLLTGSIDIFVSTTSNRLNAVTKQLAVIATIFLPLSFITGFFGQNFGWMVGHISSWPVFVGLGIGTELVALAILLAFFKRRGWF